MKRRCNCHDYSLPGLYMVTMVIAGRRPLLGSLSTAGEPHVEFTPLGKTIAHNEIPRISEVYPNVTVRRYCIMPDHIHLILHVREAFPARVDGKKGQLGFVITGFKSGCLQAYKGLCMNPQIPLFEAKYHDRIILGDRHYEGWKKYLDDNPRRLALKRQNPQYFTVLHHMTICGQECQIVGNRFLLDIPDKMAVVVHRADSDELYQEHRHQWLKCGERGGVLVSAAIAPREKIIMREAMDRGHNIILLRENGFPNLYKPAGEAFDACASGHLLQISPWSHHVDRRTITRDQCLCLNSLAEHIVDNTTQISNI